MAITLSSELLQEIQAHGEKAYPEEGAGLLLGSYENEQKVVLQVLKLENSREDGARHNRFLIRPQDYMAGEEEAARAGLDVLGIFHSHPDHPNMPSEYDREWAMPWFSYFITSVQQGKAAGTRSWLLSEDRSAFSEEIIDSNFVPPKE